MRKDEDGRALDAEARGLMPLSCHSSRMQRVKPVEERECSTHLSADARRPCSHGCQSTSGALEELCTLVTSCFLTVFHQYYL